MDKEIEYEDLFPEQKEYVDFLLAQRSIANSVFFKGRKTGKTTALKVAIRMMEKLDKAP